MPANIQTLSGVASATSLGGPVLHALSARADSGDVFTSAAVAAIKGGTHVYVDSQASLDGQSQMTSGLQNVNVVALPDAAFSTFDQNGVAAQISSQTGSHTVIVVDSGNGRVGVAGPGQTQVLTTINTGIGAGQSPGQAIATHLDTINAAARGTVTSTAQTPQGGISPLAVIGEVGGGTVGLALVLALGVAFARSRRSRRQQTRVLTTGAQQTYVPASRLSKYLPEGLVGLVKQMDDLARKHSKVPNDTLTPKIAKIINDLQELFDRIHKQGDGNNSAALAEVEYKDKLKKLVEALGPDYYLYIAAKPDMWEKPKERLAAVEQAVDSVEYQLVENIRQVNASKDLRFQVALDSLMDSKAPKVQDLYKSIDQKEDTK